MISTSLAKARARATFSTSITPFSRAISLMRCAVTSMIRLLPLTHSLLYFLRSFGIIKSELSNYCFQAQCLATPFHVRLFHPLFHTGLSRRTSDTTPCEPETFVGHLLGSRHARAVTGNMEIRNLVQPYGTRLNVSGAPSLTGCSGRAWASVGCQSKALAGACNRIGAFSGQSQRAGIDRRVTVMLPSSFRASVSRANFHLTSFSGVLASTSGIGRENNRGP